MPWSSREEAIERVPGDQAPIEQRRQAITRPCDTQLRQHERDVLVLAGEVHQDAQRAIERRRDEPRHLGLVGEIERRIDISLERELAQQ